MRRRHFFLGASGAALSALAGCGGASGDAAPVAADLDDREQALALRSSPYPAGLATPPASPKARVLVVGGGMGGATVAKYLRLWGDEIDVTLIDQNAAYVSCIMSNLALVGQRSVGSLTRRYDALRTRLGVRFVNERVVGLDPASRTVTLASGARLSGDRIVLAPGIDFDAVPGVSLDDPRMPHAWKAGAQTTLLRSQLLALPTSGGRVILTAPRAPFRGTPGPYERACVVADWLQRNRPGAKVILLDANDGILIEPANFTAAFARYAGTLEYRPRSVVESADPASMRLNLVGGGFETGQVVNLVPSQRAGRLIADAGLNTSADGRWAPVDVRTFQHRSAPGVHVLGDSVLNGGGRTGHIANQQAKICADAMVRQFAGLAPDPEPALSGAAYSALGFSTASWVFSSQAYDPATDAFRAVAAGSGETGPGSETDHAEDARDWFGALMSDTFD